MTGVDTMDKFIYVFKQEHRDLLIDEGYVLVFEDIKNNIYIFENKPDVKILLDIPIVLTNSINF